jgi:aryl-alcohol dehydrogenase-like predicted oxidoreductase
MTDLSHPNLTRRKAIKLGLLAGTGLALSRPSPLYGAMPRPQGIRTRPIPRTGEALPVVGLGTNRWGVEGEEEVAPLREVIRLMVDNGARLVDTARGYGGGRAEEVIGGITRDLGAEGDVFIATKVGTPESQEAAIASLEASLDALGVESVSAMRAHSLSGADILFPILRDWREAGRVRYFGVTTMSSEEYPALERLIREESPDVIEIDYSVLYRPAAQRILPMAQDHGVAVMVARPFGGSRGTIFPHVADQPLPDFAAELEVTSWAQLCLKYILAQPAVTAVIPGTTDPQNFADNLGAGRGELPDADLQRRIEGIFDELDIVRG